MLDCPTNLWTLSTRRRKNLRTWMAWLGWPLVRENHPTVFKQLLAYGFASSTKRLVFLVPDKFVATMNGWMTCKKGDTNTLYQWLTCKGDSRLFLTNLENNPRITVFLFAGHSKKVIKSFSCRITCQEGIGLRTSTWRQVHHDSFLSSYHLWKNYPCHLQAINSLLPIIRKLPTSHFPGYIL